MSSAGTRCVFQAGWLHCFSSHSNSNMLTHPVRHRQSVVEFMAQSGGGIGSTGWRPVVQGMGLRPKDTLKFHYHKTKLHVKLVKVSFGAVDLSASATPLRARPAPLPAATGRVNEPNEEPQGVSPLKAPAVAQAAVAPTRPNNAVKGLVNGPKLVNGHTCYKVVYADVSRKKQWVRENTIPLLVSLIRRYEDTKKQRRNAADAKAGGRATASAPEAAAACRHAVTAVMVAVPAMASQAEVVDLTKERHTLATKVNPNVAVACSSPVGSAEGGGAAAAAQQHHQRIKGVINVRTSSDGSQLYKVR